MKRSIILIFIIIIIPQIGQSQDNWDIGKTNNYSKSVKSSKYNNEMDNYDVNYYGLDLEASNADNYISGSVTIKAQVTKGPLSKFVIQLFRQFTVSSVFLNDIPVSFFHQSDEVYFNIPSPLNDGESFKVKITYQGYAGEGLTCSKSTTWGVYATWSLSESFHAFEWFPAKQSLVDKADSTDIYITVPANLEAISNGVLKQVITLDGNKKRYEWETRYPIAYYLISITVSDYLEYDTYANPAGMSSPLLIQNFVYNVTGCLDTYKSIIDMTDEMIELYSSYFGPYPFSNEKYGHVMAPFGGGMEHQTITMLGYYSSGLIAHELGHMWFGDYVTCGTWQDIWINEGFASYTEYVCKQYLENQASADVWMTDAQNRALQSPSGSVYISLAESNNENRIFSSSLSYKKGASIIHMLRYEINDDILFFNILKEFLARFAYKTAIGVDFLNVVNELTNSDYTWFFDQWYFGYGYPRFSFQFGNSANQTWVTITQTPSSTLTPLFKTSMDINLKHQGETTNQRVFISTNPQTFTFNTSPTTALEIDPNKWLIKVVGSITSNNALESDDLWLNIGPNPFSDFVKVNSKSNVKISVFDALGNRIEVIDTKEFDQSLYLAHLSTGVYTFVINDGQRSTKRKMIKI